MKLYLNKTSPYARLVMIVAHEKGLAARIEPVWVDPWANPPELLAVSAFSKVPVLVADSGIVLTESGCICDYLDVLGTGPRLLSDTMADRVKTLRKCGLGRGLIDCAFGVTIERRFAEGSQQSGLASRWLASVSRAIVDVASSHDLSLESKSPDLGDLAIAVGLSYTLFRLPEVSWGNQSEHLKGWLHEVMERPSFKATAPE